MESPDGRKPDYVYRMAICALLNERLCDWDSIPIDRIHKADTMLRTRRQRLALFRVTPTEKWPEVVLEDILDAEYLEG